MHPRYQLKIVTDFSSAHTLRDYPGKCSQMHGHNWKVEVEVVADKLDNTGMVIDFKNLRRETNLIAEKLDHKYINEISPFDKINPTAENIAAYFFNELKNIFKNSLVTMHSVTLWETERACVKYCEGSNNE